MKALDLPSHLKKYIVDDKDIKYTSIEHATWRFILRLLKSYLSKNAHESYLEGLENTGITTDEIPQIKDISQKLSRFGWRAVPVSGFIPPAVFMELQSLSLLPIASDMRTLEHLAYTPAPDIIHEAAGHAPLLINSSFSNYLKQYAEIASKAIMYKTDLDIYKAIRELSDIKEYPESTPEDNKRAEQNLDRAIKNSQGVSEAAILARMNWWTAEYGLIGDINSPKIYGAGLLSSVGESRTALEDTTQKIPFSKSCVDFSYDITEPQPQLFVTSSFDELTKVLHEVAETMAFKRGGEESLEKVVIAKTINTVELNSNLQISGLLSRVRKSNEGKAIYLHFEGPCQLSYKGVQLTNHGTNRHFEGFGAPLGYLEGKKVCLSEMTLSELESLNFIENHRIDLKYASGVCICGTVKSLDFIDNKPLLATLKDCQVTLDDEVLFAPEWGEYDFVFGSSVPGVFRGPADRNAYGIIEEDFEAKRVPQKHYTEAEKHLMSLYQDIREQRKTHQYDIKKMESILNELKKNHTNDWLLKLEIYELCLQCDPQPQWTSSLKGELLDYNVDDPEVKYLIQRGLQLVGEI